MTLRLAITLAGDTPNELGLPTEWPVLVEEIYDDYKIILFPKREMTPWEYKQYCASYQPIYDAWELTKELHEAKRDMGEKLWQACYDYNFQFYSGGAYAQILEMKLGGFSRAKAAGDWILALWTDYYTRKYHLSVAADLTAVDSISLDFSNNGSPPYSVPEMLAEAMGG